MSKHINADELQYKVMKEIEEVEENSTMFDTVGIAFVAGAKRVLRLLEQMLPADVVDVKHGEWIEEEYSIEDDWGVNNYHYHICSECHERISNECFSKRWVCCPYCGAVMGGKVE